MQERKPSLKRVDPSQVSLDGGTMVTAIGHALGAAKKVTVDGIACVDMRVIDERRVEFRAPPHSAGAAAVELVIDGLDGGLILRDGLFYKRDNTETNDKTAAIDESLDRKKAAFPPRASLTLFHKDGSVVVTIAPGETVDVGRVAVHAGASSVVLPDNSVSKRHARFAFDGDTVSVEDLGSMNGTFVNGDRIAKRTELELGDAVLLGSAVVVVDRLAKGVRSAAQLGGHANFVVDLQEQIARARHFSTFIAYLHISAKKPGVHVGQFASAVQRVLPAAPVARAALFSPTVLEVLVELAAEPGGVDNANGEARAVAEACAKAVADVAIGVAVFPGSAATVEELIDAAHEALGEARKKGGVFLPERATVPASNKSGPVAVSKQMRELLEKHVPVAAGSSSSVLILGETGAGKEVIARAVHDKSKRAKGPFFAINCAAITPSLLESELFGTTGTVATGVKERKGAFELANGGTLFLDEIGELSSAAQAALLRVLAERVVRRVGGEKDVAVDLKVVAATHRDLKELARAGRFREDLIFRLETFPLRVHPLRERPDDIPALVERFLTSEPRSRKITVDPEAMTILKAHHWPGNVRELRNVIVRAAAYAEAGDGKITAEHLEELQRSAGDGTDAGKPRPSSPPDGSRPKQERQARVRAMIAALEKHGGNRKLAAAELEWAERTLRWNMKRYGIKEGPTKGKFYEDASATRGDDDDGDRGDSGDSGDA